MLVKDVLFFVIGIMESNGTSQGDRRFRGPHGAGPLGEIWFTLDLGHQSKVKNLTASIR